MKTKPFDLKAALAGKPWGTRRGVEGLFLAYDEGLEEFCRIMCRCKDSSLLKLRYADGRVHKTGPALDDLVMFVETHTVYVNLYGDGVYVTYESKDEAISAASDRFQNVGIVAVAVPVEVEGD